MGRWGQYMKPSLVAKDSPTILDIVWASAIHEGEGHCNFQEGTHRVTVTQHDPWVLKKLKRLFGGSISRVYTNPAGSKYRKWVIYGPRARGFLMTIYKWLSPRRKKQVRECLRGN